MKKSRGIMKPVYISMAFFCILTFTGCSKDTTKVDTVTNTKQAYNKAMSKDSVDEDGIVNDAVMLTVGEEEVTYNDIILYVMMYKQQYENMFSKRVWTFAMDENKTFEDVAKEDIVNQVTRLKVAAYGAKQMDVKVEPDEKIEIEDKAKTYMTNISKEDQKKYNITLDSAKKMVYDSFLAEKVFDVVTAKIDTNISEDEARIVDIKQIEVLFNGTDKNGKKIEKSDKTVKAASEKIKKVQSELKKKDADFDKLALKYNDNKNTEIKLARGEETEAYEKAAFELKKGKTSKIIETERGYYILYCKSEKDADASKENIEKIIDKKQNECFTQKYTQWLSQIDVYVVMELWDMLDFSEL